MERELGPRSARLRRRVMMSAVAVLATAGLAVIPTLARADTLPDGRAYELVSPGLNGADVFDTEQLYTQASADGDELTFIAHDTIDGAPSSSFYNAFESDRGTAGWSLTPVAVPFTMPEQNFIATGIDTISSDLSQYVVTSDQPLAAGAPAGANLFLGNTDGTYQLMNPVPPPAPEGQSLTAVSGDFTHFYYVADAKQLPSDPVNYANGGNLYQWTDGQLSIVNVLPNGTLNPTPATIPDNPIAGLDEVSTDGAAVLFQDISGTQEPLYLRLDNATTVDVSASQRTHGSTGPYAAPVAVGVTADGSQVLFTSAMQLTNDANTGGGAGNDLYDYDVATGALTDLTPDTDTSDAAGADVQQVIGADSGADYVYFIADGYLAHGATSGVDNLYVEHDNTINFIARATGITTAGDVAYTTPDGESLAFESTDSLTGYDNRDQATGQRDTEVYLYDAVTGSLVCASCRPDGAQPTGSASIPTGGVDTDGLGSVPSVVSDDGSQVFFDSDDAVVPGATDGLQNVYEYENGTVSLISPGDGASPATLLDASPTGSDVFFVDYDDLIPPLNAGLQSAIWDARVDGGFPVTASTPGVCTATPDCRNGGSTATGTTSIATTAPGSSLRSSPRVVIRVSLRSIHGSTLVLRIRLNMAGRLAISGNGVRTAYRRVRRASTVTVPLRLTARAKATYLRGHRLRLVLHIRDRIPQRGTVRATVHITSTRKEHR